jgi:hypothetical protein
VIQGAKRIEILYCYSTSPMHCFYAYLSFRKRTNYMLLVITRLGALFMDLDALSGVVAYKHTGEHVTTVTGAFDRISLTNRMDKVCDLELSGQVTHVGRSSMEISLQVKKLGEPVSKPGEDILLSCSCTMVSLDPITRKYVLHHSITLLPTPRPAHG